MKSPNHLPPHLPAPTCSIEQHSRQERLKLFLVAAFFGVLGGMSGAAVMLGWIWPVFNGDVSSFFSYHSAAIANPFEGRVEEDSTNRLVSVYKGISAVGDATYLTAKDLVGEAAVLSTDGWLIMYLPGFDGSSKNWQVLDADGTVSPIQKVLFDRTSGLMYLKIAAQDRVVAFADEQQQGDDVFVREGKRWSPANIELLDAPLLAVSHLDSAPITGYALTRSFSPGAAVFTTQGRFIGFITKNNLVLPVQGFSSIVTAVLSGQGILYPTLGAEGAFNEEEPIVVGGERIAGFLVNKVVVKNSLLKRGDIITEVNGQIVTSAVLWHTIYTSKTIVATVLRANKKVTLTLTPLSISNP